MSRLNSLPIGVRGIIFDIDLPDLSVQSVFSRGPARLLSGSPDTKGIDFRHTMCQGYIISNDTGIRLSSFKTTESQEIEVGTKAQKYKRAVVAITMPPYRCIYY